MTLPNNHFLPRNGAGTRIKAVLIAGTHSGVGKTTLTLGLLAALRRRGLTVQPFKVGPDFIDPGHHAQAAGRTSHNLDGWMLSAAANRAIFQRHCQGADIALVEGVMGLFDGYDGASEDGSTAQMAKWLGLPVILVVDARAMARSAAALVQGFATFDPHLTLAGVIMNRVGGPVHRRYLAQALSQVPRVTCFGALPRETELSIPERHLGLITAADHPLAPDYLARLADLVEAHLRLDDLLAALPWLSLPPWQSPTLLPPTIRLGVARDAAFCFYYPDNLDWLRHFGADLVFFSPLDDPHLPEDLDGLYLGGGYPELYAPQLAANERLRGEIQAAAAVGLPIYAECGGLMYLARELETIDGHRYPMTGVLPLTVRMLPKLKALGYREITLTADCLLGPAGTTARGHEFHYSDIIHDPGHLLKPYQLRPRQGGEPSWEGYLTGRVLASYVHLHFGSNPQVAQNLVAFCRQARQDRSQPSFAGGGGGLWQVKEPVAFSPATSSQKGGLMNWQPRHPREIEAESFRRLEVEAGQHGFPPPQWVVVRRLLHTTADFDYLKNVRFHPRAVAVGVTALQQGRPLFTDTRMLQAGIATGRLNRLGVKTICLMDDPEVAQTARVQGTTRAAVAMEKALPALAGGIVAIGNAPTALLRLLELLAAGAPPPALIVAFPVGFVNAAEAKEALTHQDCPYITALGRKGGSAAAAGIINALADLALGEEPS